MTYDLNDLRLFVRVVQAGGYAKASRQTGVPRATLSRRISALEAELGLRLIERSSRSFRITSPGEQLFERAKDVIALADAAFETLNPDDHEPQGIIRFAVAPSVLQLCLDEMIAEYLRAFPRVTIQIEATNRRVDLLREGFDFAIRARQPASGSLDEVVLPFATVAHVLVVAPELGPALRPRLAETLEAVPSLGWAASGQPAVWRLLTAEGKTQRVNLTPRLTVEDMASLRAAALRGLGIALLPQIMAQGDLDAGRLIRAEFDLQAPMGRIHAAHLGRKGMRPVVAHLLEWLAEAYGRLCTAPR